LIGVTDSRQENLKPIDESSLVALAGKAAFGRGEAYYLDDRVGDLQQHGTNIIAIVEGNEKYRVMLTHTAKVFEGGCDCPASEGFDFCKHCVATALKYIMQMTEREKLQASSETNLLENYLQSLDKATLATELLTLIEYDSELEDKWKLRAELAAGKMDFKAFKKRVTKAIPYNRDLYRYAQVRRFFARVEMLVDTLQQLMTDFGPERSLELIDYALLRIDRALETIDDSGGFRYLSVNALGDMHIQILSDCLWPLEKIADYLQNLHAAGKNELYPDIPGDYLPILGSAGLDLFNAPLQAEWDKLPDLKAASQGEHDWETRYHYLHLQAPLLTAAKLNKDLDTEIALCAKTAMSAHDLIEISRLCLKHDRLEQAIGWWRKARETGAENSRYANKAALVELEIQILVYQKKYDRALELRWSDFQRNPHITTYQQLLEMARLAGDKSDFYQKSVDFLNSKTAESGRGSYDLISEIHLEEQNPGSALELALQQALYPENLLRVIRANPQQPLKILPLYIRLAEANIQRTNNNAYRDAIELLEEANAVAGEKLQEKLMGEVARLRSQYKAKRNFGKWLDEAFPGLS